MSQEEGPPPFIGKHHVRHFVVVTVDVPDDQFGPTSSVVRDFVAEQLVGKAITVADLLYPIVEVGS